jgi:hypothetical protein
MIAALWILAQAQEDLTLAPSYRTGSVRIFGRANLPDGCILRLSLSRIGYAAAAGTRQFSRSDREPLSTKVIVDRRQFEGSFAVPICGLYRVRAAFRKIDQERADAASRPEFEREWEYWFGTAEQAAAALSQALQQSEAMTRRLEKALEKPNSEDFSRLLPEVRAASERSMLSGTLTAHAELCALYHKTFAIERRGRAWADGGRAVSDMQSNDKLPPQGAPAPIPGAGPKGEIELTILRRMACREAALWVGTLACRALGNPDPRGLEEARSLHRTLSASSPLYVEMARDLEPLLASERPSAAAAASLVEALSRVP